MPFRRPVTLFIVILALVTGCETGPAVAPVTGVVRHDGQPLASAMVEFQPDKGTPSYAETDENGTYDVQYQRDRRGALLGHHRVSVSTKGEITDPATGNTKDVRERVPVEFNEESTLEFDVEKGENHFDIEITGKRVPGINRGF